MTVIDGGSPFEILQIEDNPGDVELTREALKNANVRNNLTVAGTGEEGIAVLRREGEYANAHTPDLILLDLNLPTKDGREVLAEIKNDPELKMIPIIIFTSSEAKQDVLDSYCLYANAYITKPPSPRRLPLRLHRIAYFVGELRQFFLR